MLSSFDEYLSHYQVKLKEVNSTLSSYKGQALYGFIYKSIEELLIKLVFNACIASSKMIISYPELVIDFTLAMIVPFLFISVSLSFLILLISGILKVTLSG